VESTTNRLDQDITKTGIEDKFKAWPHINSSKDRS
jgi:hypothetical protein